MSSRELALLEPSPLKLVQVRGGSLVRLFRGVIPELWWSVIERLSRYEALLAPYVGAHYSSARVQDALEDEQLSAELARVTEATWALAEKHPSLGSSSGIWLLAPWRLLARDRELRRRFFRASRVMKESLASVRGSVLDHALLTSTAGRESGTWFVYDPNVPVEVAKRLLASFRSRLILDLYQAARRRRCWSNDDLRRALMDWADSFEYAMGLVASCPDVTIPSLPRSALFDLKGEMEKHAQRRRRLSEEALRADGELKK